MRAYDMNDECSAGTFSCEWACCPVPMANIMRVHAAGSPAHLPLTMLLFPTQEQHSETIYVNQPVSFLNGPPFPVWNTK
ncbi:hypothetical protein [Lentibacillus cibarius]|uniref:hypothetical protein n=1 Tax=Lentibacillus cibarius TaxID=2583219 RepID=UPI00110B7ACE|nr:hypothetical protein [Lentibacillus cibarius]